jgi:uncharacterized cysteine cluster protein YcgN (CxxCxxCC family)
MAFWETKSLKEMSVAEWESLCDGCGKCCFIKLEDDENGDIYFTQVVCDLIELKTGRCSRYEDRCTLVPNCIDLKQTPDFQTYQWLPLTCAYRLLAEEKPLPPWHPLITGTAESVHQAGVSIRSYAIKEAEVLDDNLEDYILDWENKLI